VSDSAVTRLHIEHRTTFTYERPASASYNEVRMRPANVAGQSVLETNVVATPWTHSSEYRDYWGTAVTSFEVLLPHGELEVLATSRVEISPSMGRSSGASWETLRAPELQDRMTEFLTVTSTTEVPEELQALAVDSAGDLEPAEAAPAVCAALREAMEYVPGVTGVHTRAAEAWTARQGVCQDLAHLAAGALRHLDIPTRYVSGYLHPMTTRARPGEPVTGESHAWVEYWCGDWYGFDPTNVVAVDNHHVIVGHGREYGDVAPMRGVVAGGGTSSQEVQVQITLED